MFIANSPFLTPGENIKNVKNFFCQVMQDYNNILLIQTICYIIEYKAYFQKKSRNFTSTKDC